MTVDICGMLRAESEQHGKGSHQALAVLSLTCGGPKGQGFGNMAHILDPSISNDRNTKAACIFRNLVNGCCLGPPTGQHC